MTTVLRRYTFKLYPNKAQDAALREHARMCASLWNALLEMRETFYRRALQAGDKKRSLTAFDQGKDITALRAELAEWRAQPRGTQERVADMLDLAFKAFFRRAREGAGASSGYPRFKSTIRANAVHLREPAKSSWSFTPSQGAGTVHSGPARKSEPDSDAQGSLRARGEKGAVAALKGFGRGSLRARGEEGLLCDSRQRGVASPRARGEEENSVGLREAKWSLRLRGVPGAIKARGKFPVAPEAHKTADIRFYDNAWWFSICVAMPARREIGDLDVKVDLDLIDKFASVTDANGELLAGLSDPFSTGGKGEPNGAQQDASRARGEEGSFALRRRMPKSASRARGEEGVQPVSPIRPPSASRARGEEGKAYRGAFGDMYASRARGEETAEIQSARDRRFKRFSCRWRREKNRIARISARKARQRREALHRWTTSIARISRALELTAPPKRALQSGRGTEQRPGAEVTTIALLNRRVLDQAPAAAIAMLEYKLAEAGGACAVIRREDHEIGVGGKIKAATVAVRRAKRAIKKEKAA